MNLRIISAGAGSGKTYTLMEEIVGFLNPKQEGKEKVRASGIIATTFTNKAAAELKERVRSKLLEEGMTKEAAEVSNALIGTVHSIGVQLLKRFAFEVGVSPQVDIIMDTEEKTLFHKSLSSVMTVEWVEKMEHLSEMLGFYAGRGSKKSWRDFVKDITDNARANNMGAAVLAKSRDYSIDTFWKLIDEDAVPSGKVLEDRLKKYMENTISCIINENDGIKKTAKVGADLKQIKNKWNTKGRLEWYEWVKIGKLEVGKKNKVINDAMAELKIAARDHVQHPTFRNHVNEFTKGVFDIAIAALNEYEAYKKQRGLIDYIDMEVKILELLDKEEVREVLADELDLLLVDEFQDTNPIQLKIFLELSKLVKEAIWVGDPKQSIYGFRGAAPRLMKAVVALAEKEDKISVLENSWRSREDLVFTTNAIFCKAFDNMPEERIVLNPAPINKKSVESPLLKEAMHHWYFRQEGSNRAPSAVWSSQSIAHEIKRVLDEGWMVRVKGKKDEVRKMRAGDIAVLCRGNKGCATMADCLHKEGLKASIARTGLLETAEIALVLACLKYMLNPSDSLSVAEILLLASDKPIGEIVTERMRFLEESSREEQNRYYEMAWDGGDQHIDQLRVLRQQIKELSAKEILDLVIEKLDVWRIVAAWGNERQRWDNLDALRNFSSQYEEACNRLHSAATLGGFLLWLDALKRDKADKQGSGESLDAVRVLTYHASKGLEWPMVICHDLDNKLKDDVLGTVRVIEEKETVDLENPLASRLLCFWVNPYGDQKKSDLAKAVEGHTFWSIARQEAREEENRLFYVGVTRARDYLVFPSFYKKMTTWLNRVYMGDEKIKVMDTDIHPDVCPWAWKDRELALDTVMRNYPKELDFDAKQTFPTVPYLEEKKGEQRHSTLIADNAKELIPDLEVNIVGQHTFDEPLMIEDDSLEYNELNTKLVRYLLAYYTDMGVDALNLILDNVLTDLDDADLRTQLEEYAKAFYDYLDNQLQAQSTNRNTPVLLDNKSI